MRRAAALLYLCFAATAAAQPVQSWNDGLVEDAAHYSSRFSVSPAEALRRLKAEQDTIALTDSIAREFAGRLAGISIDNGEEFRILVLLTGDEPVPERSASGITVAFRTGAKATRAIAVDAMRKHLIDLRTELPGERGAGYDQRTGEVVLLVTAADAGRFGIEALRDRAERISGVPVRIEINDLHEENMAVAGGGRVEGINPASGRNSVCTTAFVITDGTRTGIATAAHCADQLTYVDEDGARIALPYVDQWGRGYQDVQVNLAPGDPEPVFRADRGAGSIRRLATWRNLSSTRAGDFVCHYGESSGYSCSTVELTDYAPPGAICAGPCSPTWVTVKGPDCIQGDSGGPIFSGSVAIGIAKGINAASSGRCNFYYYMSTDFLPPPWRLLTAKR